MTDLLRATAELVDIASPSLGEGPFADLVEGWLREVPWLTVDRHGDNVVARTELGRDQRLVLAGHLDTVPANGNERARIEGDTLWGLGSADMKGGLAVFLELARTVAEPVCDVTYVFYAAEEIAAEHNGLRHLFAERPELVAGDAAILGEPTDGWIEAGCQGTARVRLTLRGARAHTARPWKGRNAIHRLAPILDAVAAYEAREPTIDGCTYREAMQAVFVEGGVAGNVVPDEAVLTVNLRIAPDRTVDEAVEAFRAMIEPFVDEGDGFEVVDRASPAPPSLTHPLLAPLVEAGTPVRAKLGWTDVARFAEHGIPAVNLGPGDSLVAHMQDEQVHRDSIERVHAALHALLTSG
ncbi:MAG TPA: succinyl-diaminopimelate desuccinylase [Acidimicrobiales bacterium]|nr:succinyl-diaminopimelate desuccinylase [Acidimicrobiales bacterium]